MLQCLVYIYIIDYYGIHSRIEAVHLTSFGRQTNHQCMTIMNIHHIAAALTANFYCYHESARPLYNVAVTNPGLWFTIRPLFLACFLCLCAILRGVQVQNTFWKLLVQPKHKADFPNLVTLAALAHSYRATYPGDA